MDLRLVLSKGRLYGPAVTLLRESGIDGFDPRRLELTGKAIGTAGQVSIELLLIRDDDVPTYVARGAADLGIVGKDVLDETGEEVVELLDLGVGACRLSLAVPAAMKDHVNPMEIRRVATKYPATCQAYFRRIGWPVQIIKLHGAVELAPRVGLADAVVDLVATGKTLKEAGLLEVAVISTYSARLIGNRASFRTKTAEVRGVVNALRGVADGDHKRS